MAVLVAVLALCSGAVQAANYEPDEPSPRAPVSPRPVPHKPAAPLPSTPAPSGADFAVGPAGGATVDRPAARPKAGSSPPSSTNAASTAKPGASRASRGAPAAPSTLTLDGPSVVILEASAADMEKVRDDESFKDFRAGFDASASRFLAGMKAHPQVRVLRSSADEIRFADPKVTPVQRYSVDNGHGYVFYQPGAPVRVLGNVRSGDGLLCEAARTFRWKPAPPNCEMAP